ncbi:ABC transporter substrate-binding protein [Egicoccus sp. AB-alg2]|uniref:ABC transporter substrate-binding protein n=1 Tax=Egicoccus sp. AB-alg2 TaxID=3242693 RepID=UPI00359DAD3B
MTMLLAACGGSQSPEAPAAAGGDETSGSAEGDGAAATDAGETRELTMQLGWIASNNQLGEIVAQAEGFYAEEGIELTIEPGGPNVDGVALVASGQADIGQLSSSPSLMLAVSEGIPVKAFATGAQEHPYTYFSMPETPLDSAEDLAGLHVGTQATGEILLDALLAANDMSRDDLADFTAIGAEITPLLAEQVDVWTGWLTNTQQLNQLPEGHHQLRLWDAGVQLYALPYYARTDLIENDPEVLEAFLRATAKGWQFAQDNFDVAIDHLLAAYPNLEREAEEEGAQVILEYVMAETALADGWGAMDPDVWQAQLDLWDELGQFQGEKPALEDIVTLELLDTTADARQVR